MVDYSLPLRALEGTQQTLRYIGQDIAEGKRRTGQLGLAKAKSEYEMESAKSDMDIKRQQLEILKARNPIMTIGEVIDIGWEPGTDHNTKLKSTLGDRINTKVSALEGINALTKLQSTGLKTTLDINKEKRAEAEEKRKQASEKRESEKFKKQTEGTWNPSGDKGDGYEKDKGKQIDDTRSFYYSKSKHLLDENGLIRRGPDDDPDKYIREYNSILGEMQKDMVRIKKGRLPKWYEGGGGGMSDDDIITILKNSGHKSDPESINKFRENNPGL